MHSTSVTFKHIARNQGAWVVLALAGIVLLFVLDVALGPVKFAAGDIVRALAGLPTGDDTIGLIVWQFRLPKAVTALLAGAALGVAGLQMQTLFRNPLADPFILGVSSGASLGVALVVLAAGAGVRSALAALGVGGSAGLLLAASAGSMIVFALIMLLAARVHNPTTLIVLSLMVGYLASALVSVLMYFSAPEMLREFTFWSFGSFGGTTWPQIAVFAPVVALSLLAARLLAKPLDALQLGPAHAASLGVNVRLAQRAIASTASVLAAAVTAFCGPIGFLGVAMPHLARGLWRTASHASLTLACALLGALVALLVDVFANAGPVPLPVNVLTALLGAPLVAWVILRRPAIAP